MKKKYLIVFIAIMIATVCMALVACNNNVTYSVSFETNGGTEVSALTADKGTSVDLPSPTREGFIFDGWFDNEALSGNALSSPYTPVADTTLYAKWSLAFERALGTYVGTSPDDDGFYADVLLTLQSEGICSFAFFEHNTDGSFDEDGNIEPGTYTIVDDEVTFTTEESGTIVGKLENDVITFIEAENEDFIGTTLKKAEDPTKYVGNYSESIEEDGNKGTITLTLDSEGRFTISVLAQLADGTKIDECLYQGNYYISGNDIFLLMVEDSENDENGSGVPYPQDHPGVIGSDEVNTSYYEDQRDSIGIVNIKDGAILVYIRDYAIEEYTNLMLTPSPTSETPCVGGAHSFSSWIRVTIPNCIDGTEKRFCSVCGERETRTGTATAEHNFNINRNGHGDWGEFPGNQYHIMVCRNCRLELEPELHTFGELEIEEPPTCAEDGSESRGCTVCGYRQTRTIPATGEHDYVLQKNYNDHWKECSVCFYVIEQESHTYGDWTDENPATCTEAGSHKHACTVCEHCETVTIPATGHSYGGWETVKAETCGADGEKKRVCPVCETEERQTIPATGNHTFGQKFDGTNHWQSCSVCGEKKDIAAHALTEKYNETAHWQKCGGCGYASEKIEHKLVQKSDANYHWEECSDCGFSTDKSLHPGFINHHDETYHWETCEVCGQEQNRREYDQNAYWHNNDNEHWQECSVCREKINIAAHGDSVVAHDTFYHILNCGVCGHCIEETECFSRDWQSSDLSHWNECDVCGETVKFAHDLSHDGECGLCHAQKVTEGLVYTLRTDGKTGYAVAVGDAANSTEKTVRIPAMHEDPATGVALPVTAISDNGFANLPMIHGFYFPASIEYIGLKAFENSSIDYIDITDIAAWCAIEYAWNWSSPLRCTEWLHLNGVILSELVVPDGVTKIGDLAFYGYDGLTSVTLPDSVTAIGNYAFSRCGGLTSITIPNSVKTIDYFAFAECSGLKSVTMPTRLWGDYFMRTVTNDPKPVPKIEHVTLTGTDAVHSQSFKDWSSLKSVTFRDRVTGIGMGAFEGCRSLTSITIPSSVTEIGTEAFSGCDSLTEVHIDDIAAWCAILFDANTNYPGANPLTIAKNLYLNDALVTDLIIPDGVTSIGSHAFYNCSLETVTIPSSVTGIGENAFYGCNKLNAVHIGDIAAWCRIAFDADGNNPYGNPLRSAENLYLNGTLITDLVIPEGVTSIGKFAFYGCSSLESVSIPNSVTKIDERAFSNCTGLSDVTIPGSVSEIGYAAFNGCTGLTNVVISDGVTKIGQEVFGLCTGLTGIMIPLSVQTFGWGGAFYGCDCLTIYAEAATKPDGWQDGWNTRRPVVWDCNNNEVADNGSIYYIADDGVRYALKDGVATVEKQAAVLQGGVVIPEQIIHNNIPYAVTTIAEEAFYYCRITSITIPGSLTSIGADAFYGAGLTEVHISDLSAWCGIVFADYESNPLTCFNSAPAFYLNGTRVTYLEIPNDVTAILDYAFADLSELDYITIPDSVTSIGNYAFNLWGTFIYAEASTKPEGWQDGWNSNTSNLFWGSACITRNGVRYLLQNGEASFSEPLDSAVETIEIPDSVLYNGISYAVTSIGDNAFSYSDLTAVTIPDSVKSIGSSAFSGCGLTNMIIPDSVTSIGNYAFSSCDKLASITIGNGVTSIGECAFFGCIGLTSVTIPDSVTSIGESAFGNCVGLTEVHITSIEAWCGITFNSDTANPLYFAHKIYMNAELITELVIPDSITSIGEYAFSYCWSLTSVTIPDSVTSIGEYAFSYCWSLTSVTIGNGVTSIGGYAFNNCSGLTSVTIPDSVTSIGSSAFENCSGLTEVYYAGTITEWDAISIDDGNNQLSSATRYYYSKTQPTESGNYWHYDADGVTVIKW